MSGINFLNTEDVANKKKGGKGRYIAYKKMVVDMIDDLNEAINDNEKNIAVVGVEDMQKNLNMTAKSEPAVLRGLKFALWNHDIVVDVGEYKGGKRIFIFKDRTNEDKLPESLAKIIDE